jgi:hypothetical protein
MTRLFRLWASEGDRNSAYFACAAFDRDWHIATETMLMTGGRFRGKAEVRQDELRNMKVSKIEVFQRNARFARAVAEFKARICRASFKIDAAGFSAVLGGAGRDRRVA